MQKSTNFTEISITNTNIQQKLLLVTNTIIVLTNIISMLVKVTLRKTFTHKEKTQATTPKAYAAPRPTWLILTIMIKR